MRDEQRRNVDTTKATWERFQERSTRASERHQRAEIPRSGGGGSYTTCPQGKLPAEAEGKLINERKRLSPLPPRPVGVDEGTPSTWTRMLTTRTP